VILLLCLALAGPDEAVARDLAHFAAWCQKSGLRGFRDRACEALLRFAPDDEQARKTLRYTWNKKQLRWVRAGNYRRPTDTEGPSLEEARERWRLLTRKYADAVLDDTTLDAAARARALAHALHLAPDYARAREANGEVRRGEGWILAETARSTERAREISALRRDVLDKVAPPAEGAVTAEDKKFGIAFPTAWVGGAWRALGTVDAAECKELLRYSEAAHPFLARVFGLTAAAPRGFSLYVIPGQEQKALAAHPAYSDEERQFALALDGSWVPGAFSFVAWSDEPLWRRDVVVRAVFGLYLKHRFGVTAKQGWAWEGFGSYLTYHLAGTRLAVTAQRTPYAQDRRTRATQQRGVEFQKTDWAGLARKLFEKEAAPDLRLLVAKDANSLTAEDSLLAFAMAEYLATGFPDRTGAFLKAYGHEIAIDAAMATHLGFDFAGFETRFVRWLRER